MATVDCKPTVRRTNSANSIAEASSATSLTAVAGTENCDDSGRLHSRVAAPRPSVEAKRAASRAACWSSRCCTSEDVGDEATAAVSRADSHAGSEPALMVLEEAFDACVNVNTRETRV
jgi:hypothetical protein